MLVSLIRLHKIIPYYNTRLLIGLIQSYQPVPAWSQINDGEIAFSFSDLYFLKILGSHQDLVTRLERQCQDYVQQLLQANEKIETLRLQNASLKTQLQSNEQSLQELQRSLTGATN